MRRCLAILTCCLLGAAAVCSAAAEPGHYVVRKGDSLSVIAARFGYTVTGLKRHNRLDGDTVHIGQKLEIAQPFARTRAADVKFRRPFAKRGKILEQFGPYKQDKILVPRSGVKMACPAGSPVAAPAHAVVRYVGWMDEYGTLVILEHGGGYHTVLAPLAAPSIEVKVGQAVIAGEVLGHTATPPQTDREPYLHVELRKNEKSIDPARLLK